MREGRGLVACPDVVSSWFQNGHALDAIRLDSRALQYGDGLFETVAIRDHQPRLWTLHVERLLFGCDQLGIKAPDPDMLVQQLEYALQSSTIGTQYALAKIIVSAGSGRRGYQRSANKSSELLIGIFGAVPPDTEFRRQGVLTRLCETSLAVQPALAGIKSLNRLEQVLARAEWQDPDVFEGLMCDTDGQLICGTMSNVFVIRSDSVSTPALDRCGVAGVMRQHVLNTLSASGMTVRVCDISWDHFLTADEVFLTNSQFGVLPVRACDEQQWPVGSQTIKILTLVAKTGIEECTA